MLFYVHIWPRTDDPSKRENAGIRPLFWQNRRLGGVLFRRITVSFFSLVIFASLFPLLSLKSVHRNHWFVLWQVQVAISSAQEAFSLLLDFLSFFGRGGRGQIIHFWLISAPRPISAQRFSANAYTRSCAKKNYWSFFEKKEKKWNYDRASGRVLL